MVYRQALKDATENKTEEEAIEQQQDDDERKPFRVTNNLNVVKKLVLANLTLHIGIWKKGIHSFSSKIVDYSNTLTTLRSVY